MKSHPHHLHHHLPLLLHLKQLKPSHPQKTKRKKNGSESKSKSAARIGERNRSRDQYLSMVLSRDNNNNNNNQRSISQLHEKLQLLRSITHSHAVNEASVLVDASKYIEELKEKVEILNRDITTSSISCSSLQSSNYTHDSLPTVRVETLEKGFLIKVKSEKNCPGLLVSVLEAFEHLNLDVSEATASCSETFRFEAVSSTYHGEEQVGENVNAQVVRQAVLRAIRHWSRSTTN